jgi:hypothetical protein
VRRWLDVDAARLPDVPDEIPTVHFRDALQLVGANPDERISHRSMNGIWVSGHGKSSGPTS